MKQASTFDRQLAGRRIIDPDWIMRVKDFIHPLLMLLSRSKVQYKIVESNTCCPVMGKPIIYAFNHSSFMDTPIALRLTGRSIIFSGKQNLAFEDWLFFVLNGVIWVDRKNKADMQASKEAVLAYLSKNQPILWFPEGTWNLTENQMTLPMKWGIIDIAREAEAQIIPIALDYDRVNRACTVRYGQPILPNADTDLRERICGLRDAMATLRWELWEQRPMVHRTELDMEKARAEMRFSIQEYPPIDWEYERSCIFRPNSEPQDVFAHLNGLNPSRENAFLIRKN